MKKLLMTLGLALTLWLPSWADHVCYGTVTTVTPQTVWISNAQGTYAVPVSTATFQVGGVTVQFGSLYPGLPVAAYTPVYPQPVYVTRPVYPVYRPHPGRHRGHYKR
ncbi:MAG: hypothetical protein AB1758_09500 [Candidatus Eremiobacterota bacterium]